MVSAENTDGIPPRLRGGNPACRTFCQIPTSPRAAFAADCNGESSAGGILYHIGIGVVAIQQTGNVHFRTDGISHGIPEFAGGD